jgi:hypothetical protein
MCRCWLTWRLGSESVDLRGLDRAIDFTIAMGVRAYVAEPERAEVDPVTLHFND